MIRYAEVIDDGDFPTIVANTFKKIGSICEEYPHCKECPICIPEGHCVGEVFGETWRRLMNAYDTNNVMIIREALNKND